MNVATPIRPTTSPTGRGGQPRLGPRTNLWGGVVLMLAWSVVAGMFLFDIARPPRGAKARESNTTSQAGSLALSSPVRPEKVEATVITKVARNR